MSISTPTQQATDLRVITDGGAQRREHRAVSYCDIWDLVSSGEPCPACEDSFQDRLKKARGPR